MRVEQIMSRRLVTVDPDQSVMHLRAMLEDEGFHHLVVVEDGRLVGVISDRDVLRAVSPFEGTPSERRQDETLLYRRAHQIMTRAPVSVAPDERVSAAARLMLERSISCLPVVEDDGRCIGIMTLRDIARLAVDILDEFSALRGDDRTGDRAA